MSGADIANITRMRVCSSLCSEISKFSKPVESINQQSVPQKHQVSFVKLLIKHFYLEGNYAAT